eukprot:3172922-Pyramimonas_sp.AAC.3
MADDSSTRGWMSQQWEALPEELLHKVLAALPTALNTTLRVSLLLLTTIIILHYGTDQHTTGTAGSLCRSQRRGE